MRSAIFAFTVAASLTAAVLPAQAAWHSYAAREAGFSFMAPGDVKSEKATYKAAAGQRPATVYRSLDDNIEYKVTVVDFAGRANDDTALIKEAATALQTNRKVLADAEAIIASQRLSVTLEALARSYDHVIIDAGALPDMAAERFAEFAPCAVLVAGASEDLATIETRERLRRAGFGQVSVLASGPNDRLAAAARALAAA